jgi:uncharacterized protein YkwD
MITLMNDSTILSVQDELLDVDQNIVTKQQINHSSRTLVKQKIKNSLQVIIIALAIFVLCLILLSTKKMVDQNALTYQSIHTSINEIRQKNRKSTLSYSDNLQKIAQKRAIDMRDKKYFGHFDPNGNSWKSFFDNSDYNYTYAGENLAKGYINEQELLDDWMNSPSHKENILYSNFEESGVYVLKDGNTNIIVQSFGRH